MLGYAEAMQQAIYGAPPETFLAILTRIRSNGKHLLGLINTVLACPLSGSDRPDDPVRFELTELTRQALAAHVSTDARFTRLPRRRGGAVMAEQ
jgi:hypothetical protein